MTTPITPSGKLKVMVAQAYHDPFMSTGSDAQHDEHQAFSSAGFGGHKNEGSELISADGGVPSQSDESDESISLSGGKKTLLKHVKGILESFGFPGRMIADKETELIKEDISAEGTTNVVIQIPDRHMPDAQGNNETVESEDIAGIVKEIQSQFGLHFNGAGHSDKKWSIKFTSEKNTMEDTGTNMLDDIYGPSKEKGGSKGKKTVRAFTQTEMIKSSFHSELQNLLDNTKQ